MELTPPITNVVVAWKQLRVASTSGSARGSKRGLTYGEGELGGELDNEGRGQEVDPVPDDGRESDQEEGVSAEEEEKDGKSREEEALADHSGEFQSPLPRTPDSVDNSQDK